MAIAARRPADGRCDDQVEALTDARDRTLALVAGLDDADLARVVDPLLSPLVWDLGHIANFEQRWLLGSDDDALDRVYNPFEQPRAERGELPLLHRDQCFAYMGAVREQVLERFDDARSVRDRARDPARTAAQRDDAATAASAGRLHAAAGAR